MKKIGADNESMMARTEFSMSESTHGKSSGRLKNICIGVVFALLMAAIIGIVVYFTVYYKRDPAPHPERIIGPKQETYRAGSRMDCLPEYEVKTKEVCGDRKCVWDSQADIDSSDQCYVDLQESGYRLEKVEATVTGQLLYLKWEGEPSHLYSEPFIKPAVEINYLHEDYVRIKFVDLAEVRYEVPIPLNIPTIKTDRFPKYQVMWSGTDEKFHIQVRRTADQTIIFDTSVADLFLEDQFLSVSTSTPSANVYGFGENQHTTFKHQFNKSETWPLFARDQPPKGGYSNLYGVHPFYTCIEKTGKSHGVFLLNSNAQDYTLTPGKMITYRTIGGILDFFIFTGPSPNRVIEQYTNVIGRPYMPPYWALGFQLCRYGYQNTSEIRAVVDRTRAANIPHDVQYADIDYMDARKDFTIDEANFGDMPEYFQELRQNHSMKIIIILDPALSIQDNYTIYPQGQEADIYIKWPIDTNDYDVCPGCSDNRTMLGYVWPDNKTAFPDFFKERTQNLWEEWIKNQSVVDELEFDGLWIDMNEPANFDTNKDRPWNWDDQRPGEPYWNLICDMTNDYENPPYKTKATYTWGPSANISDKTLCMVGTQGENEEYSHYDVHNLYGWSQSEPTVRALRAVTGKRGMVISRSTFPGSGVHAGHWLGDNTAEWGQLRESIIGMLEFNMFGIPYVGADICGFFEDSNAQLCKRWMQLGAFYPFSRNHNGKGHKDHDPASFPEDPSVAELSRKSLETRYKLLPYLYTLFHHANTRGAMVVRPLQFEWASNEETWNISEQFMWGNALIFSPILYEDQKKLHFYLPAGVWYSFYEFERTEQSVGAWQSMDVNDTSEIPIHIRGGTIIPMKESALTTTISRKSPFSLIVALIHDDSVADGELYWDHGDEIDPTTTSCSFTFHYNNTSLNFTSQGSNCVHIEDGENSLDLDWVKFLGITSAPTDVLIKWSNSSEISTTFDHSSEILTVQVTGSMLEIDTITWTM